MHHSNNLWLFQVIREVSSSFTIKEIDEVQAVAFRSVRQTMTDNRYICMSTLAFTATLVILLAIPAISCCQKALQTYIESVPPIST